MNRIRMSAQEMTEEMRCTSATESEKVVGFQFYDSLKKVKKVETVETSGVVKGCGMRGQNQRSPENF